MKKTISCPNCGIHKSCIGKPGEKKILVCSNCYTKGYVLFPKEKTNQKIFSIFGGNITKKQIAVASITLIILMSIIVFVVMPTYKGDMHFLTVLSGSMEPDIKSGDVVISCKIDPDELKVGDVITFQYNTEDDPNKCVTHRVNNIYESGGVISFETKGDANEDADQVIVKPGEIIGKVSFVVPYLGYFGNFARSSLGFLLFLVIPAILIIIFEIFRIFRIRRDEKNIY